LSALRRRIVLGIVIAFAIWPAVQLGLVLGYDVNPWKLAGWGMYSAPQIPCYVRLFGLTPDDVGRYELRTLPPELEPVLERFLHRRRSLRRLVEPGELGRALLRHYSAVVGIEVEVVQPVLDPSSGTIEERSDRYVYARAKVST